MVSLPSYSANAISCAGRLAPPQVDVTEFVVGTQHQEISEFSPEETAEIAVPHWAKTTAVPLLRARVALFARTVLHAAICVVDQGWSRRAIRKGLDESFEGKLGSKMIEHARIVGRQEAVAILFLELRIDLGLNKLWPSSSRTISFRA